MVYTIDSAYFGDEKSSRNVTKSLVDMIKGDSLNVTADEKLYPAEILPTEVKLTPEDEKNIRSEALKKCNAADQRCLEAEMSRLRTERTREKEREAINSTPVIKGRRLTANVIDENGQRRTIVVPDGQKLQLQGVKSKEAPTISKNDIRDKILFGLSVAVSMFIFVLIVAIPFKLLKEEGNPAFAWGSAGANLLVPYTGSFAAFAKYFWQGWTNDKNTPKQ